MGFRDVIKKSVLEGFSYTDFTTTKIAVTLGITALLALYLFGVYKQVTKRTFYNRDFNVAMSVISIITAGIVMAMQSNLVISLGMVGALSIIRFRTAIKDPSDLLFLFWSISIGIICGAGLYELAILLSMAVTVGLFFFQSLPVTASPFLLILKLADDHAEKELYGVLKQNSFKYKISSKSIVHNTRNLILEIRGKEPDMLVNEVSKISGILSVTLMHHDGEVKF